MSCLDKMEQFRLSKQSEILRDQSTRVASQQNLNPLFPATRHYVLMEPDEIAGLLAQ